MNKRPMFPHAVDSTILAAFRSCPQKMFRTYMEHWKPRSESVHLVAGGAFAKGVEVARRAFYEGKIDDSDLRVPTGDRELAEGYGINALMQHYGDYLPPADSPKSLERMCGALEFYFMHYPLGGDGTEPITLAGGARGIEFSFAEPLPITHPVTGDPILYTGRSDMIAEFAGGTYIFDEKTTSQLGASWSRQWEMRSQFTGYCWAAGQSGIKVDGAIVRGVSILKTKYDTQQAITYRSQMEIDRWLTQVVRDIERMKQMWADGWWDYNLDHACGEYGGCSLAQVCKSPDPYTWLNQYFEQRVWDPLAKRELTIQEWEALWEPARLTGEVFPIQQIPG